MIVHIFMFFQQVPRYRLHRSKGYTTLMNVTSRSQAVTRCMVPVNWKLARVRWSTKSHNRHVHTWEHCNWIRWKRVPREFSRVIRGCDSLLEETRHATRNVLACNRDSWFFFLFIVYVVCMKRNHDYVSSREALLTRERREITLIKIDY